QLEREGREPEEDQGPGGLLVFRVAGHLDGRLFELVDLTEDAAQRLAVPGAEVAAAGLRGNLPQERLVDADRQQLVTEAAEPPPGRNGRLADGADADGIHLDAVGRRRRGGGARVDQA